MIRTSIIGGQELTRALAVETRKLQRLAGKTVLVGFPESSGNHIDEDGEDPVSIVQVAAWNEFGTKSTIRKFIGGGKGSPARPFLRAGVNSAQDDLTAHAIDSASKLMDGDIDPGQALDGLGLIAVSAVQQYMVDLRSPPNAWRTIKKKKSSNPLIDSGELKGAVTFITEGGRPTEGL